MNVHIYQEGDNATITVGQYRDDADHFEPGLTAEIMIYPAGYGQKGSTVRVSQGGRSDEPAVAVLRAGIYEEAARMGAILERLINTEGFKLFGAIQQVIGGLRFVDHTFNLVRTD